MIYSTGSPLASDVNPFARLKDHVKTAALELYAESNEKEPFWFLYHKPKMSEKLQKQTLHA